MLISSCRILTNQNSSNSSSITSFNSTNLSNKHDGEWILNSISSIIFILALIGNTAALVVMFGSRGSIRLTNNKYLVNLACADLLRACFMPFTIIARMKRNFIFGPIICKILPIVQGLSVAVDVFTLVFISVERYIAICRPLLILKLQSLRFANFFHGLILFLIWALGFLTALPNYSMHHLCSLPKLGRFKCEKVRSLYFNEKYYMVTLLIFYFVAPMLVMLVLYILIICKMYKNTTAMRMRSFQTSYPSKTHSISSNHHPVGPDAYHQRHRTSADYHQYDSTEQKILPNSELLRRVSSQQSSSRSRSDHEGQQMTPSSVKSDKHYRKRSKSNPLTCQETKENRKRFWPSYHSRTNSNRSHLSSSSQGVDRHRRKALKLLIVIILEFFICWTPLFIYHTVGTFDKKFYRSMPTIFVDVILVFSFASLLCNPLTYYFMSKRYRTVLYEYLSCFSSKNNQNKFSKKDRVARQIVKALRLHQQQNSLEYQQKIIQPISSSPNYLRYYPKIRANTLQ